MRLPALLKDGHVHLHDPKYCGKVFLVEVLGVLELDEGGLAGNRGGDLVVGEAEGEGWGLLDTRDGVQAVNSGYEGLAMALG